MSTSYNYEKFTEWMGLRKYSPYTTETVIRTVEYFMKWAKEEGIEEITEICYQDAMMFMQWSSKHGASQKTINNYLGQVRKFFNFLMSEGEVRENPVAHIKVQGIKRKIYYDILSPEDLQHLYESYPIIIEYEAGRNIPPQTKNILSRRRNKVILGLLIYQGLRSEELAALRLEDLRLKEGKIMIHAKRRTAARMMKLESHQVYELMDYVHVVRKEFLQGQAPSDKLFLHRDQGQTFHCLTTMLLVHLRRINPRVKNTDQIRASVITEWLKHYDIRKVQYLAGHKYVSSTEAYKANVLDGLQDDVTKFHPL